MEHVLLAIEDLGGSAEAETLLAGNLGDRALGREAAPQDLDVARLLDGIVPGPDHLLIRRQSRQVGHVLGQGLACHGQAAAVENTPFQQHLVHGRDATDVVDVFHHVRAAGLQVGQEGDAVAHLLEVVEAQFDADGARHGDQVQHRVGRASQDRHHDHGVLEGGASHDCARLDVLLEKVADRVAGPQTLFALARILGRRRAAVGQRQAQRLDGGRHGVGRIHAATGAGARTRVAHDVGAGFLVDVPGNELTVGLKRRDDVERVTLATTAGLDGAAVDHQRRTVQATHGNDTTRHVLVTAGQRDQAVVPLAAHHGLD